MSSPINVIYFHYPCQDGLASAWVATKSLKDYNLVFHKHGNTYNTDYSNKTIYFLDMAPPVDVYNKLKENNTVYILDHHISNQKDYQEIKDENVIFDMNKSGVGITWTFFNKTEMPTFLKMIQGKDLWNFSIPNTKEFCEALQYCCSMIETVDDQLKLLDEIYDNNLVDKYVASGTVMLKQKNIKVKRLVDKYINKIYDYEGHKVCMVNCDSEIASELGNALSSRPECDFAILWRYDHIEEKYLLSFRSDNKVDISLICKKFNGGGHKNAAGCSTTDHPIKLFT
jgi:oligoribonuclease NrnB/cAMP/cGMP phosphodiesterase (DHH superfamily)